MATLLAKIERDSILARAAEKENTIVEKTCRISLAHDWPNAQKPRAIELPWCKGLGSPKTLLILRPGATIEQPLDKCHAWFGPFDLFKEYEAELHKVPTNEKLIAAMRDRIASESARYLTRYDYPRGNGRGSQPDMTPVGPHRSPDITIQVLDAEGNHDEPIRLYEVYQIGEFDELAGTFQQPESQEQIESRFQAQLLEKDREVAAMRRELAQLAGMVKGVALTAAGKGKAVAAEPAVAGE